MVDCVDIWCRHIESRNKKKEIGEKTKASKIHTITSGKLPYLQQHKLLREGFKGELEEFIRSDPRFTELMMDLTSEFAEQNIPLEEEDHQTDMALIFMESQALRSY